jgi:RNA polymerase sporulation-specific sigma factor
MEQYNLLQQVRRGDAGAREQMILDNVPLVWALIRRFPGMGQEREELFQAGMVGLVLAIDRFDPSYQVQFSTYAVPVILGEIRGFLRKDRPVKLSRSICANSVQIQRLLQQEPELDLAGIAERTGLSMEDVILAFGSTVPMASLSQPGYDTGDGELPLMDQIPGEAKPVEQEVEEKQLLQQALNCLEGVEQQLIGLRYFERMSQSQVGKHLGMSQVQVSRMEKKILQKMRKCLQL